MIMPDMLDITVMGERGQIVIPKKMRDMLDLKAGSKMMVIHHGNGSLILVPADKMKSIMKEMHKRLTEADKLLKT